MAARGLPHLLGAEAAGAGASGERSKNTNGASIRDAIQGTWAPLVDVADAQAHALEQLAQRQAAFAHHLGKRLGVGAVGPVTLRRDRSRRGIEGDQRAGARLDQRETAGKRRAGHGEGIGARGVEDEDARLQSERAQRPHVIGKAQGFGGDVGRGCECLASTGRK